MFAIASFSVYQMAICGTHVCHSMRTAGIYKDEQEDGGRWELFQALRWASIGEIFSREEGKWIPCPSGFGGFGFTGGQPETVLDFLLNRYGVSRWPVHGKMLRCRARTRSLVFDIYVQVCCSRFAAQVLALMSVRHVKFTDTLQFASSIRQALVQGQEPALSFNSVMFDESPLAVNKIASAQIKTNVDAMDCITRQDVPADPTREWKCTHAVVIGSGSMKDGSQALVIKDSNYSNPWFVESIDVMAFHGAEVRAQILDIFLTLRCSFSACACVLNG